MSEKKVKNGDVLVSGTTTQVRMFNQARGLVEIRPLDLHVCEDGSVVEVKGKGALVTAITRNILSHLRFYGIPVAYEELLTEASFSAPRCDIMPLEVAVVRGPSEKEWMFPYATEKLPLKVTEKLFLRTSGRVWNGTKLLVDNPLAIPSRDYHEFTLYSPWKPTYWQNPLARIATRELFPDSPDITWAQGRVTEMSFLASRAFTLVENVFRGVGRQLAYFQVSFGCDVHGRLLIADVIKESSLGVLIDGKPETSLCPAHNEDTLTRYGSLAKFSERFRVSTPT